MQKRRNSLLPLSVLLTMFIVSGIACQKPAPPVAPPPPPPAKEATENKGSDEVVLGGDPSETLLKAGQVAPDFKLTLAGGKQITLKEALAKNKVLWLNFWSVT